MPIQTCTVGARLCQFVHVWTEYVQDLCVLRTVSEGHSWNVVKNTCSRFHATKLPRCTECMAALRAYVETLVQQGTVVTVPPEERDWAYTPRCFFSRKSRGFLAYYNLTHPESIHVDRTLQNGVSANYPVTDSGGKLDGVRRPSRRVLPCFGACDFPEVSAVLPGGLPLSICLPTLSTSPRTFTKVLVVVISILGS